MGQAEERATQVLSTPIPALWTHRCPAHRKSLPQAGWGHQAWELSVQERKGGLFLVPASRSSKFITGHECPHTLGLCSRQVPSAEPGLPWALGALSPPPQVLTPGQPAESTPVVGEDLRAAEA